MIAEIIVDVMSSEVDKVFDYRIPSSLQDLTIGYRVSVPFGNRQIEGYVIAIKDHSDLPDSKIKDIISKLDDFPLILPEIIDLIWYMKNNLYLRLIDGIRLAVPSQVRSGIKDKTIRILELNDEKVPEFLATLTKRQKNIPLIIELIREKGKVNYTEISKRFGNSNINTELKLL